ncbi:MAG: taurine catabolism dioxygenase TauD [Actinobacteria bacterium]|nr:taurine catabolism dioxygenase TauD [Actinomycetota bacterium]|tara:strand:- start:3227 stop:4144 length:918 start_codon:yes stop_codon:yes gene_type:complete
MKVEHLTEATFGSVVTDIDLETIDDAEWRELYDLWIERALLVFPGAFLSAEGQDVFARRFGDLEFSRAALSNIGKDGKVHHQNDDEVVKSLRGNEGWHIDSTYMPVQAKGAVFSAEIVPSSGAATGWADMRSAYEELDSKTRERIADLEAYHSLYYSQGRAGNLPDEQNEDGTYNLYGYHDMEVSLRPLIKTHPITGRPSLLIGRHAHDIVGMDPAESESLLDDLNDWACQPPRTYHHQWDVGDAVLWDNRRLQHRGTPFDMTEPRRMWHTRIAGDPSSELALNHHPDTVPSDDVERHPTGTWAC